MCLHQLAVVGVPADDEPGVPKQREHRPVDRQARGLDGAQAHRCGIAEHALDHPPSESLALQRIADDERQFGAAVVDASQLP